MAYFLLLFLIFSLTIGNNTYIIYNIKILKIQRGKNYGKS